MWLQEASRSERSQKWSFKTLLQEFKLQEKSEKNMEASSWYLMRKEVLTCTPQQAYAPTDRLIHTSTLWHYDLALVLPNQSSLIPSGRWCCLLATEYRKYAGCNSRILISQGCRAVMPLAAQSRTSSFSGLRMKNLPTIWRRPRLLSAPGAFLCFPLPSFAFLCLPLPAFAFLCLPLPSFAFLLHFRVSSEYPVSPQRVFLLALAGKSASSCFCINNIVESFSPHTFSY